MTALITLLAESPNGKSTLSKLYIDNVFTSYILEDGYRREKKHGETRIEGGKWRFTSVKQGRFFDKYSKDFGHAFAIGLEPVGFTSRFDLLRCHIGNKVTDTEGCTLTGLDFVSPSKATVGNYETIRSTDAYKKVYDLLAPEIEKFGFVDVTICRMGSQIELKKQ